MSATLYWRPVKRKGHLPDGIRKKLEHNSFPLEMNNSDLLGHVPSVHELASSHDRRLHFFNELTKILQGKGPTND